MDLMCAEFEEILILDPLIQAPYLPTLQHKTIVAPSCKPLGQNLASHNGVNSDSCVRNASEDGTGEAPAERETNEIVSLGQCRVLQHDQCQDEAVLKDKPVSERHSCHTLNTIYARIDALEAENQIVPAFLAEDPLIALPAALESLWVKWKEPALKSVGAISSTVVSGVQAMHEEMIKMQKHQREAEYRMEMEIKEKSVLRRRERLEKEMIDKINKRAKLSLVNADSARTMNDSTGLSPTSAATPSKCDHTYRTRVETTRGVEIAQHRYSEFGSRDSAAVILPVVPHSESSLGNYRKCGTRIPVPVSRAYTEAHNVHPNKRGVHSGVGSHFKTTGPFFFQRKSLVQDNPVKTITCSNGQGKGITTEETITNEKEHIRLVRVASSFDADAQLYDGDRTRVSVACIDPGNSEANIQAVPNECESETCDVSNLDEELIVIEAKFEFGDSTVGELKVLAAESCMDVSKKWVACNWNKICDSGCSLEQELAVSALEKFLLDIEENTDKLPVTIHTTWENAFEVGRMILQTN